MPIKTDDNDPLYERLMRIYEDAKKDLHYPAYRFLGKLKRDGGIKAAKYYLRPSTKVTDGFARLLEHDRLDLSVEAVALEGGYQKYFTAAEIQTAQTRLEQFGYFKRREAESHDSLQLTADELPNGEAYPEGSKTQVSVNAYERNPEARLRCIEHYGPQCFVCGFDFGKTYGEIGEGRIQVHHLAPLAGLDGPVQTNPVADLRPVCPNCHWMLHRRNPPIPIAELKEIMKSTEAQRHVETW